MISWKNLAKIKISSATFKSKSGGKPSPRANPKQHRSWTKQASLSEKIPLLPLCPVTSPCLEGDIFPAYVAYFLRRSSFEELLERGSLQAGHSVYATPSPKAHAAKQGETGKLSGAHQNGAGTGVRGWEIGLLISGKTFEHEAGGTTGACNMG